MKYLNLLFIAVLAAAIAGCKKELLISDSLTGTWELRQDMNGLSGRITYHKPGNDSLLVFTNNTYASYAHNQLLQSGAYTVKRDSIYVYGKMGNRIIYNGQDNGFAHDFYEISNNQLTFFLDAYDAPSVTYQRVK